eukprot:3849912-Prymnesium_polylepis.1
MQRCSSFFTVKSEDKRPLKLHRVLLQRLSVGPLERPLPQLLFTRDHLHLVLQGELERPHAQPLVRARIGLRHEEDGLAADSVQLEVAQRGSAHAQPQIWAVEENAIPPHLARAQQAIAVQREPAAHDVQVAITVARTTRRPRDMLLESHTFGTGFPIAGFRDDKAGRESFSR